MIVAMPFSLVAVPDQKNILQQDALRAVWAHRNWLQHPVGPGKDINRACVRRRKSRAKERGKRANGRRHSEVTCREQLGALCLCGLVPERQKKSKMGEGRNMACRGPGTPPQADRVLEDFLARNRTPPIYLGIRDPISRANFVIGTGAHP